MPENVTDHEGGSVAVSSSPLRKWLLIFAGMLCVVLGAIGIVLPLLPTTPFLLLAAACFVRSSDRLYAWLTSHRVFGSYIKNYREHRGMTTKARILTLIVLWAGVSYATIVVARSWILRLVLLGIAVSVTIYLMRLRTVSGQAPRDRAATRDGS